MSIGGESRGTLGYQWSPLPDLTAKAPRIGFSVPWEQMTDQNAELLFTDFKNSTKIALDTETDSLEIDKLEMITIQFRTPDKNYIIPYRHGIEKNISKEIVSEFIKLIPEKETIYTFNCMFDMPVLHKEFGLDFRKFKSQVVDVSELVFLADSNHPYPSLKAMERLFLGIDAQEFKEFIGQNLKLIPMERLGPYSCMDSWGTYELGEKLYPELLKLYPFIVKMDRRFLPVLHRIQETDQVIDTVGLRKDIGELKEKLQEAQSEFYETYGFVNINSKKELRDLLLTRGYDTGVQTSGGKSGRKEMSVSAKALQNLGKDCHIANLLIKMSKFEKLLNTYYSPLLQRIEDNKPVKIHYVNKKALSYRLSCGGYNNKEKGEFGKNKGHFLAQNLQSAPKPKQVIRRFDYDFDNLHADWKDDGKHSAELGSPILNYRKNFIVPEGYVVLSEDYSGEELRILAQLSGERAWIDTFAKNGDIHMATAKAIFGEHADGNHRKICKAVNFAVAYGGSEYAISRNSGVSVEEAKRWYDNFMNGLPFLARWMESQKKFCRKYGYVQNIFGLPCHTYQYYRMGRSYASYADRLSLNFPIQSSGGVMIRLALIKVSNLVEKEPYSIIDKKSGSPCAYILSSVHDEINVAVRKDLFYQCMVDVKQIMESVWPSHFEVRMEAGLSVGENWGELIPLMLDTSSKYGFSIDEDWDELAKPASAADGDIPDFDDEESEEENNEYGFAV